MVCEKVGVTDDGTIVEIFEGTCDGAIVGDPVGKFDGYFVGGEVILVVGPLLGFVDGEKDGILELAKVGSGEGEIVGPAEGYEDGLDVATDFDGIDVRMEGNTDDGRKVGITVGNIDGSIDDGATDGTKVRSVVGFEVGIANEGEAVGLKDSDDLVGDLDATLLDFIVDLYDGKQVEGAEVVGIGVGICEGLNEGEGLIVGSGFEGSTDGVKVGFEVDSIVGDRAF